MRQERKIMINWNTLYVGFVKKWISKYEVVKIVNEFYKELDCSEDLLLEFNINQDEEDNILKLLNEKNNNKVQVGVKYWELKRLLTIEQSDKTIEDKLNEIAKYWADFDYPESWKDFIYYMPNKNTSSSLEVYENFIHYLEADCFPKRI